MTILLHRLTKLISIGFCCSLLMLTLTVSAQVGGFTAGGAVRPSDQRPLLPDFSPKQSAQENNDFILPPIPKTSTTEQLSSSPRFHIKQIILEGNTLFSDKTLKQLTKNYENRLVTMQELMNLRRDLTLYYTQRGYVNSGVIIPDQKIASGIITLKIIEGHLVQINITGNQRLRNSYLKKRLMIPKTQVLNVNDIQQRLQLLRQNSLIKNIHANLVPSLRAGEAELNVKVKENRAYHLGLQVDNHHSPSIGAEGGSLNFSHDNVSGWGDQFQTRLSVSEGLDNFSVAYLFPFTANGATVQLRHEQSNSNVLEQPFEDLDIESKSRTSAISIEYPWRKTLNQSLVFGVSFENKQSETFLLGRPFSFSEGSQNGKSDITAIRLTQTWLTRDSKQVFSARSTFSFGLDIFDATINDKAPDGTFVSWLGQFQFARRWGYKQLILRADMQFTNDPLLSLEKFSLGGANSIRGYRENQLVRDNAIPASAELRLPLWQTKGLQWLSFVDYGWGRNANSVTPDPRTISSLGLGLRWDPTSRLHAELYWGFALRNIDSSEYNLQDDGIHFLLNYQIF